ETGSLGDEDRDREPGGAANAVLEPDRADAGMLDRELLRRFESRTRRRRLPSRNECVTADLAGGVGHRSEPERRLERLQERVVARVRRQVRQASREWARDGISRCVEAGEIGAVVP